MTHKTRARIPVAAAVLTAALALSACGAPATQAGGPAHSSAVRGHMKVTLIVSTTSQVPGRPIKSWLVFVNHTGKDIRVPQCEGNGVLTIGIGNLAVPFQPANGDVVCSTLIPKGRSVFPQTILTTYQGCGGPGVPACGTPPQLAPLPRGTYRTSIE